jgi:hypothetical protein
MEIGKWLHRREHQFLNKKLDQMLNRSFILLLITAFCIKADAQITKIEHFFASSPQAEKLFHFFSKDLGLPVVWNFQTWTDFSSGGVTLGNVAFELVNYKGVNKTWFDGIALEPRQPVEEFIKDIDRNRIVHDTIQHNTWINDKGVFVGWSNLGLMNVLPVESNLFICDYKAREAVLSGRNKAGDKLKQLNGGALGIISMKEIIIGTTDYKKHKRELQKLPGIKKKSKGLFVFSEGPDIRLRPASINGNQKIIVHVKSLPAAKEFLQKKNWLGEVNRKSIFISPQVIEGLKIELVEK